MARRERAKVAVDALILIVILHNRRTYLGCVSELPHPRHRADQVNCPEEVQGGLFVAGGDATPLLQAGEEVFDSVTQAIQRPVEIALRTSITD